MAVSTLVLLVCLTLVLAQSTLAQQSYTLYHRIGDGAWSKRATIRPPTAHQGEAGSILSAQYEDLTGNASPWTALPQYEITSQQPYQLALTPDGIDSVQDASPITFTRTCHLAMPGHESITLHTDANGSDVVGISYELPGLDAAQLDTLGCPNPPDQVQVQPKQVVVTINRPQAPLSLTAPSPPPARADGTPLAEGEEPPKEQSFFRKYWYYILPVVIMMLIPTEIADANNDEAENGDGGGSGAGAKMAQTGRGGGAAAAAASGARRR